MFSVFVQIPVDESTDLDSPEWGREVDIVANAFREKIMDSGYQRFGQDDVGGNATANFWTSVVNFEDTQRIKREILQVRPGWIITINEAPPVTVIPVFSFTCPKCKAVQTATEDDSPIVTFRDGEPHALKCETCDWFGSAITKVLEDSNKRQIVNNAMAVVADRNGRPREDDGELAEAAMVLLNHIKQFQQQDWVTCKSCGYEQWLKKCNRCHADMSP